MIKELTTLDEVITRDIANMIKAEYKELHGTFATNDITIYEEIVKHHFLKDVIYYEKDSFVCIIGAKQDPLLNYHQNYIYHIYFMPSKRKTKLFKHLLAFLVSRYGIITGDTLIQSNNFNIFTKRKTPIHSVRFLIGG